MIETSQSSGREVELTSFVGRSKDLAEGRRLLGEARLVTLTGPGGVGKTRLARRLCDELARAFADGTHVVELAEVHDPAAVAAEVATSLGLEDIGRSPEAAVADYVRERRLLLVLDNCEHLVEPCARLVGHLLQSAPYLRVLATSRQLLGVPGEQLMAIAGLSLPPPGAVTVSELADSGAAALFVERARLVDPGFALDADNAAHVARVCTLLDGLPLAIELAVARLRLLSPAQLVERLGDRFALLTPTGATRSSRHATLRASVEWSYELCSEAEQTIWARMSVFEGGADLEAVEAVCSASDVQVFDAVAGLVDKSVLVPFEAAGRVRYRMLESIRDFGLERLAERDEAVGLRGRHRDYFVGLALASQLQWFGPEQRDVLARLTADMGNLRAALDTCLTAPVTIEGALQLTSSMWHYWLAVGAVDEGSRWFERTLSRDLPRTPRSLQALSLHALSLGAYLAAACDDRARVELYGERALAVDLEGDESDSTRLDRGRVTVLLDTMRGDLASAIAEGRRSLDAEGGDEATRPDIVVELLVGLALRLAWAGRQTEALQAIEQGIDICVRHGEEANRSYLLSLKGARLAELGLLDEALAVESESLRLARGFNRYVAVNAVDVVAGVRASLGQDTEAAVLRGALSVIWPHGVGRSPTYGEEAGRTEPAEEAGSGPGDTAAAQAYDRGRKMTLDEVVAFILGEPGAAAEGTRESGLAGVDLTEREGEVAELVARGLSNKEIARILVISPRTAEGHVTRLLAKLGFSSRARVAAWVAEQRSRVGSDTVATPAADPVSRGTS